MADWLFNSGGHPVVFHNGRDVWIRGGDYLGRLDGSEIWHGRYQGEIVQGHRIAYDPRKATVVRGRGGTPSRPGTPGIPGIIGAVSFPAPLRDVELE